GWWRDRGKIPREGVLELSRGVALGCGGATQPDALRSNPEWLEELCESPLGDSGAVRMRKRRPSVIWSCTKSSDQRWFGASGSRTTMARFAPAPPRPHRRFCLYHPKTPLGLGGGPSPPQQHPKSSIAEPPARLRQRFQPLAQRIVIGPPALAPHARSVHANHT